MLKVKYPLEMSYIVVIGLIHGFWAPLTFSKPKDYISSLAMVKTPKITHFSQNLIIELIYPLKDQILAIETICGGSIHD